MKAHLFACLKCVSLGLEVKGGPQAAIHVKGHGRVLVDDSPGARIKANSVGAPETPMIANLPDFSIMRSADNLTRENIMHGT